MQERASLHVIGRPEGTVAFESFFRDEYPTLIPVSTLALPGLPSRGAGPDPKRPGPKGPASKSTTSPSETRYTS
jgi:hypothetical protein